MIRIVRKLTIGPWLVNRFFLTIAHTARPRYGWAMNLEDHLGDILGKARQSANVSTGAAAAAAGFSEPDYADLERTGRSSRRPDFDFPLDMNVLPLNTAVGHLVSRFSSTGLAQVSYALLKVTSA